ncbi:mechanosensitive ion channel family protein [Coprobacter tertius]|uniref:Mechanosensitive ion channel family protein n=1 Tax=Coprobacter tertius TaxID=2944915 RepID=A0ABT1MGG6_9BACT|nr:mechanosensitive ion channel domain-containing protein [Coprobacter tertius]MCP9611461.1 mechanosensitive ion channel family protein [Coprobacter tertius]
MKENIKYLNESIDGWIKNLNIAPDWFDFIRGILVALAIILLAVLVDYICRFLISNVLHHLIRKTKATWDDMLLDRKVLNRLALVVPAILIFLLIPLVFPRNPGLLSFFSKACLIYIIAVVLRFFSAFINIMAEVAAASERYKNRAMKGLFQTLLVILFFVGAICILAVIFDKSPVSLLAGLGASAAILSLVFKDTIVGFVAGIQLLANDMLRPGDWITMPKYGADGWVLEVTLNTVKIRNFDNTIVTVPPYAMVSDSFQNWRGMFDSSGGRRIKRSVNIDMRSVRFCTDSMLDKFTEIPLIKDYVTEYRKSTGEDPLRERLSNLTVFREYLDRYIHSLSVIMTEGQFCLVRYLDITDKGLPVEIYCYSARKMWIEYEKVVATVIDHILSVIPEFGLRVFQNPAGSDLSILGDLLLSGKELKSN